MRPIKFRAWHKQEKRMYHWGSGITSIDHQLNIETVPYPKIIKAEDVELMQFTGLHDKNGNDIYEGDLVKDKFGNINEVRMGHYFNGKRSAYGVFAYDLNDNDIYMYDPDEFVKVVGNIYENKDLLEKEH